MHEPLPDELVSMVMLKLALTYGKRFSSSYDADPATVRAHWAHELAGVSHEGVLYALSRLPPDYVPNVLQFRNAACCRPESNAKRLPAPKASPERVARAVEALGGLRNPSGPGDPVAWAYKVLDNPSSTHTARTMATEALRARGRL